MKYFLLITFLLFTNLLGAFEWWPEDTLVEKDVIIVEFVDEFGPYTLAYWVDDNGYMWIGGGVEKINAILHIKEKIKRTQRNRWLLDKYNEYVEWIKEKEQKRKERIKTEKAKVI